jgi:hypothetical protein
VARKRKKQETHILFAVTYEDGSVVQITIDRHALRSGDHVARIIAGEWQRDGRIPEGKITSVSRMRFGGG